MYLFYLGGMLFPVTPSGFVLKDKNQNRSINLVSGDEVSLPERAGLCEISFSALLPMVRYPFCIYEGEFKDGMYFARLLRNMKDNALPVWLRVLRYGRRPSTDILCVIEELKFTEDAENGGDIICDIVLKEYRDYATKIIETGSSAVKTTSDEREVPNSVKVVSGDTLWTIAKRHYGDGSRYPEIYAKNAEVIESAAKAHDMPCSENGRFIFEGTELIL